MEKGRWRRAALLAVWAAAAGAAGGAPYPEWALTGFPRRVVFMPPPEAAADVVLVSVPLEGAKPGGGFAAWSRIGAALACRPVAEERGRAWVAVGLDPDARRAPHILYYGGEAGASDAALRDRRPVFVEVYTARGKGVPNSWDRFAYLMRTAGRPADVFLSEQFGAVGLPAPDSNPEWRRGRRRPERSYALVRQQSYVLCPTTGVYRFALDCENAGFVRLDDELAVEHPGEHPAGEWRIGRPTLVKAGVHRLEAFNYAKGDGLLRVGWLREGIGVVEPLPATLLLAGQEATEKRLERVDRTLHPAFVYEIRPAYTFRGLNPVFVPVRFRNTSVNWVGLETTSHWRFDGGGEEEGESPRYVFDGLKEHRVRVEIRDELGFVAANEQVVDCRSLEPARYAVDARILDMPAVCYEDDKIEASLAVAGETSGALSFDVDWQVRRQTETTRHAQDSITLAGVALAIPLVSARAGTLSRVDWRMTHQGIAVDRGVVRFLRPPFGALPARVEGDRLYDADGAQLVLVLNRAGGDVAQPPITTDQAFGTVLCADDCLAAPDVRGADAPSDYCAFLARFVDGPDRPVVRYLPLPAWETATDAYGLLLKLTHIPQAVGTNADVAILSIGRQDLRQGVSEASFERNAAALSDIISATLKRPVVWVTPPPYPAEAGRARAYAAAIRRVAAARSMPVADVFTAFSGYERPAELFLRPGEPVLTQAAQHLAGQVIARALLAE